MLNATARSWFQTRRGISAETLEAFGVETEGDDVIRFPYPGGASKYRKGLEKEDGRSFWWDPPTQAGQVPFLPPDFERGSHMILLEGETDTMALWENAPPEARKQIVGLSGAAAWKDNYTEELFGEARTVFVVFDNDDPYKSKDAHDSTEREWQKIRRALGRKARRVVLPQGVNDVAEFFQRYGWGAFRVLLDAARTPVMPYPRLDLTKEPGPVDWIVDGLIAAPDITVLYGDGGVSKSLFQQALAVAMAEKHETFLGVPLLKHGRALYIDEENPEDVVLGRLRKLGLTDKGRQNLYYVWYGGVRLDQEPEKLYEAVTEFEPEIVFIDSFSRVNTAPENDSDVMNTIFTNAVYPIARGLKVPVMALHHANKSGGIRGSTAIRNAADLALKVEPVTSGGSTLLDTYRLSPDKPRRGQSTIISYRVAGLDSKGEPTDILDKEARIELQSMTSHDEPY